jgi:hypothetical protein
LTTHASLQMRRPGTLAARSRYRPMTRRTDILVTVDKIKLTRKLEANLTDFVRVARAIGYQPKHAETTLKRFREELASYREDLKRLTLAQPRPH